MDPIANMIVSIKNAGEAGLKSVVVPYSNLKHEIGTLLVKEGYLESVAKKGKKAVKSIELTISYKDKKPKINGVERISKISRRVYVKSKDIKPVRQGYGIIVVSTPKGIMTGKEARRGNLGGEAMFKIW